MLLAPAPDFSVCRPVPLADGTLSGVKDHAKIGVRAILANPYFFLADDMGAMKTAQSIIGAQFLFTTGVIDRALVVAPATVRPVWFDPELGELAKHLWLPSTITEFHARIRKWTHKHTWTHKHPLASNLEWIITNYEFIRAKARLEQLLPYCNQKTLLILDESSAIKSHKAEQTKACLQLRRACGRVLLLNGTPIAHSPMDLYSQGAIMDARILGCKSYFHFRSRYALMGGWQQKVIVGYQNLEDLQQRFKPYILRRLKKDCLDLPPSLPSVTLTVTLSEETWKIYKAMRDEMVAWLSNNTVAITQQAAVKGLRLAQITSGFLGGVEDGTMGDDPLEPGLLDSVLIPGVTHSIDGEPWIAPEPPVHHTPQPVQEIGREKLDFVLSWFKDRLEEDPNLKLLVWCRFRPELARMMRDVQLATSGATLGSIHGGQKKAEREAALRLLDPRTAPSGPVFFGGTYGTGALGLNLTASHTVVNMSYDFSYYKFLQSAARVDRPGQVHPVSNFDIVAVGPKGQKTLDHAIIRARRSREDIAQWTTAAWVKALTEE